MGNKVKFGTTMDARLLELLESLGDSHGGKSMVLSAGVLLFNDASLAQRQKTVDRVNAIERGQSDHAVRSGTSEDGDQDAEYAEASERKGRGGNRRKAQG